MLENSRYANGFKYYTIRNNKHNKNNNSRLNKKRHNHLNATRQYNTIQYIQSVQQHVEK